MVSFEMMRMLLVCVVVCDWDFGGCLLCVVSDGVVVIRCWVYLCWGFCRIDCVVLDFIIILWWMMMIVLVCCVVNVRLWVISSSVVFSLLVSFWRWLSICCCMVIFNVDVGLLVISSCGLFVKLIVINVCWYMLLDSWCG